MRFSTRLLLTLCFGSTLILGCGGSGDLPAPAGETDDASGYRQLMEAARIPGLGVATLENGEVVGVALVGVASAETGEAVSEETLFEAASLSKPVFGTAVLRLAERGEFDLDEPLHELMPYERISHDPRSEVLTARLVLSHRTGLPNWGPERLEFINDPGEAFGYSGEGFVYLQRVVETVTGLSLDDFVRREVFEPLGMTRSRFSWPEGEALPLAVPHDQAGGTLEKRPAHEGNAAASLHTTGAEYGRFVVAWMGGELLGDAAQAEALEPVSFPQPDEESADEEAWRRLAWGLGWGIQLDERMGAAVDTNEALDHLFFHWGDNGPFKAFVAFRPATGDGIVYFANSTHGLAIGPALVNPVVGSMDVAFEALGYERVDAAGFSERLEGAIAESEGRLAEAVEAYRAALTVDPDNEITARQVEWIGDLLAVEQSPVEVPVETLESYAGSYGPRRLVVEEGELFYRREGRDRFRLIPLTATLFALDGMTDFRLEIDLGQDGRPKKIIGHYVGGGTDESPRDP